MKNKHTPGPWRKQGNIIFAHEINVAVARIFTQHIPGKKSGAIEESANARLISCAPELLEVLYYANRVISDLREHVKLSELKNAAELAASLTVIDDIIAKATGESE